MSNTTRDPQGDDCTAGGARRARASAQPADQGAQSLPERFAERIRAIAAAERGLESELARVDRAVAEASQDNAHGAAALPLVQLAKDHVESLARGPRTERGATVLEAEILARGLRLVAASELAQEAAVSRLQHEMNQAFEATFFELERIASRVHGALGTTGPDPFRPGDRDARAGLGTAGDDSADEAARAPDRSRTPPSTAARRRATPGRALSGSAKARSASRAAKQLELLQIDELYGIAIEAGDMQRAELCYRALQGDPAARTACQALLAVGDADDESCNRADSETDPVLITSLREA